MKMLIISIIIFNTLSFSQENHNHHKMKKERSDQNMMNMEMNKMMKDSSHQNMMNMKMNKMMKDSSHQNMMNMEMDKMMKDSSHQNMMNMKMDKMMKDSSHQNMMNMEMNEHQNQKHSQLENPIIRKGIIDLDAIDKNKDGKLYEDTMDWYVISDTPGNCPVCGMTLEEFTIDQVKKNLTEHGLKYKD